MNRRGPIALGLALIAIGLMRAPAASAEEIDNETCLTCHGDPSTSRFVDQAKFEASVHGSVSCTACHTDVTAIPHDVPLKSVSQSQIPLTCGQCHEDIKNAFQRSIHGQAVAAGKRHAPVCTDCHGEHYVAPVKTEASKVFPSHIPETCGQCHAAERIVTKYRLPSYVVDTYMGSFHGLAHQLGSVTAANCASCHGTHEILPASDERSSVNPKNLAKTCGACHPGVGALVAQGKIHSGSQPGGEHPAVAFVRRFYLTLISLVIGGMLIHNGLDFRKKLAAHYRRMALSTAAERMSLNERLQHGVLMAAFFALAYTGFALKFPHAWWASPFMGRVDWRRLGHRGAAVAFCLLAGYHLWFMTCTKRGREELRALWPRRVDAVQLWQMIGYYVGWRAARPRVGRYSYVEKMEYWALVWGSIIMVLTGDLMIWKNWTLRVLPKWAFDVIGTVHFYEAILACLAIVVWHFYFAVFDPEEYPMKWTWISGRSSPADDTHRDGEGGKPPAASGS